jgi:hypothetical protein
VPISERECTQECIGSHPLATHPRFFSLAVLVLCNLSPPPRSLSQHKARPRRQLSALEVKAQAVDEILAEQRSHSPIKDHLQRRNSAVAAANKAVEDFKAATAGPPQVPHKDTPLPEPRAKPATPAHGPVADAATADGQSSSSPLGTHRSDRSNHADAGGRRRSVSAAGASPIVTSQHRRRSSSVHTLAVEAPLWYEPAPDAETMVTVPTPLSPSYARRASFSQQNDASASSMTPMARLRSLSIGVPPTPTASGLGTGPDAASDHASADSAAPARTPVPVRPRSLSHSASSPAMHGGSDVANNSRTPTYPAGSPSATPAQRPFLAALPTMSPLHLQQQQQQQQQKPRHPGNLSLHTGESGHELDADGKSKRSGGSGIGTPAVALQTPTPIAATTIAEEGDENGSNDDDRSAGARELGEDKEQEPIGIVAAPFTPHALRALTGDPSRPPAPEAYAARELAQFPTQIQVTDVGRSIDYISQASHQTSIPVCLCKSSVPMFPRRNKTWLVMKDTFDVVSRKICEIRVCRLHLYVSYLFVRPLVCSALAAAQHCRRRADRRLQSGRPHRL